MMSKDLTAPGGPSPLSQLRAEAHTGSGARWLFSDQADALARYALKFHEGVRLMEACAPTFHEPVRDVSWEMIGADSDGENWEDHRDPQRAYRLFQAKLRLAARDGVRLKYKLWLGRGA